MVFFFWFSISMFSLMSDMLSFFEKILLSVVVCDWFVIVVVSNRVEIIRYILWIFFIVLLLE